MNTNALKRFAREARIKLLDQVGRKMDFVLTHDTAELRGKQREIDQLKKKIAEQGKEQVIEMVAYTWFNRLMALRFMDANGYTIPKVVTPNPGMSNPEILQNALGGNLEPELQLERQRLNDLLDGRTAATDAHTDAYKLLLVAACNYWHSAMPFMFERISDYTELLLPDDLLSEYGIVADIRHGMNDEDCQQEELIGWLYQFYIAEKKDDVFDKLKKNIKITAENIPAATQLFTPRWIVRYMVENTLGKLWVTLKPESKLRQYMPYYIEAPEGNAPAPLPEGIKGITDISFLDPCMGSGHVLVYAFDLFSKIYEEEGFNKSEIPALIFEHNLYGMDIDERATQLAAFALTMKARSYYSRFLRKPVQPHVIDLQNIPEEVISQSITLPLTVNGIKIANHKDLSLMYLTQADNLGSLIQIAQEEAMAIKVQQGSIWQEQQYKLKVQAEYLSRNYQCVVTNPPYLGSGGMNPQMVNYVKLNYTKSKSDLMACFMERCLAFASKNGKIAMINQHSWMFLSSYAELRTHLIDNVQFDSMLHLGPRTFPEIGGEVVQNTAFVFSNFVPINTSIYFRLTSFENSVLKEQKTLEAINRPDCSWIYKAQQRDFEKIPSSPIGYWASQQILSSFQNAIMLNELASPKKGLATTDNNRFLRYWYEVENSNIGIGFLSRESAKQSAKKWFPLNKGGGFRKWYGNKEHVINWFNDGVELKNAIIVRYKGGSYTKEIRSEDKYFIHGITWSALTSNKASFRYSDYGALFDSAGSTMNPAQNTFELLALLNSPVVSKILMILNPTLNFGAGTLSNVPIIIPSNDFQLESKVKEIIAIVKQDWNIKETSWDFQHNELIEKQKNKLSDAFIEFKNYWSKEFFELHNTEEVLNKYFIETYGLQNELKPDVSLEEITILQEESKIIDGKLFIDPSPVMLQLVSFSIGCFFGRYSLDKPGLILANQGNNIQEFQLQVPEPIFIPDADNILPVLEGEWFTDDIVGRFKSFLRAAFSPEYFEENLKFIEDTIGKDIRKYFVRDFYNDHIKRYKKRPIYWMFSSPKGHFKALIYMHRYQPDLCSRMLNDYLQPFISKLEAAKQTQNMLTLGEDVSPRERTLAIKEIDKLELMLRDCREYEKTLFKVATQKISIDLDDGVKVNYQKFKEVLIPIKGLEKEEE
jgi:hypothetical protein